MKKTFYNFISEDIKTVNYSDIETWKEPKDRSYTTGIDYIKIVNFLVRYYKPLYK